MSETKVNWGVLGCAEIAMIESIPGILMANNAALYAVASRTPEKLAMFCEKFSPVKAYESYDQLLEDDSVEAVYIPLPNALHLEWVVKAATKKKHVLCEKPLGISTAEVEKMKAVCDQNGVLLMEAFAYRHCPVTLEVKRMMNEGAIGRIHLIDAHFTFGPIPADGNIRLSKPMVGGAAYDVACYPINFIRYIMDSEPVAIHAEANIHEKYGVDVITSILMRFENGVIANAFGSICSGNRREYTIQGEYGLIHVSNAFNDMGELTILLKRNGMKEEKITISCPNNYMLEFEQFGRCIRKGERPLVCIESSLAVARILDKVKSQIY